MMKEAIQGGPEGLWKVLRTSAGYSKRGLLGYIFAGEWLDIG
jgi:hypothetical protein